MNKNIEDLSKRIEFRVKKSEKKFFQNTSNTIGIDGSKLLRYLLNTVKAQYESGQIRKLEDINLININVGEPINQGLIRHFKKIKTNMKQIISKLILKEEKDSELQKIVKEAKELYELIDDRLNFVEQNSLSIEEGKIWLKILVKLGEEVNQTAKMTNSKLILEDSNLSKSDKEKLISDFYSFTMTIDSLLQ